MSAALSRYLKDFGAEAPPPPSAMADLPFDDTSFFADIPETPPVDIEAERRDAYLRGQEDARTALAAEHQARLGEIAEAHRRELDALRSQYEEQAAESIRSGLGQIAAALAQVISGDTAVALGPVMTEAVRARAVAELAALVEAAILEGAAGQITVSGPRDLFEKLRAGLGEGGANLRHIDAADLDLSVTLGDSVLVTRISAWADGLRKVLA